MKTIWRNIIAVTLAVLLLAGAGGTVAFADDAALETVTSAADTETGTTQDAAEPVINTYTITYDANGGKGAPSSQKKTEGKALTLRKTAPTRKGYTFLGWATSKTATTAKYKAGASFTANKNTTLYAVWKANTYKIAFNKNGGKGTMTAVSRTYGKAKALPVNQFTRSGYKFLGWNTKKDGSGTSYGNKASVKNLTSVNGKKVTLYARWGKGVTATYNANGGKVSAKSKKVYQGAKYGTLPTPTRKGYTFAGWYTKKSGGTKVTSTTKVSKGKNHTLYAHWTKKKYTITYKLNGGKNSAKNPASYYITTATISLKNPTREGYNFKGWYSDSAFTQKVTKIAKGTTGKKTLYAKWVKKTAAELRAEEILATMSWKEKVAQMFVAGAPDDADTAQQQYQFGGYVFFQKDFSSRTPKTMKAWIQTIQNNSKIGMLIAVDEEGGTVNRVSSVSAYRSTAFASPQTLYKQGGYTKITSDTKTKAAFLQNLGINTNFAPVADTPYKSTDFIYSRSFSTNAKSVAKYVKTVVTEMKKQNLVSTLKHFPGYGGNGDTHTAIITDTRSKKTFETRDLLPFSAGIDAGCDMIMVSHNIVNCFDKTMPASLSKKVHQYLRNTMEFDGVIISDSLSMAGAAKYTGGTDKAAIKAIQAGNDMIISQNCKNDFKAVYQAFQNGEISKSQINASVKRILVMKLNRNIIS